MNKKKIKKTVLMILLAAIIATTILPLTLTATAYASETKTRIYSEASQKEVDDAISLGMFRLTSYCQGHCCNGKWGNVTAIGGTIVPGRTIAVDPEVIPLGTWVLININGEGWQKYKAEDTGSGVNGRHIDMAVFEHDDTFNPSYNMYAEVKVIA